MIARRRGGDEGDYPGADCDCPDSPPPWRTNPEWVLLIRLGLLTWPGRTTGCGLLTRRPGRTKWVLLIIHLSKHAEVLGWANKWL